MFFVVPLRCKDATADLQRQTVDNTLPMVWVALRGGFF